MINSAKHKSLYVFSVLVLVQHLCLLTTGPVQFVSAVGLADLIGGKEASENSLGGDLSLVVQRTRQAVEVDQFQTISNDVNLFTKAMQLRYSEAGRPSESVQDALMEQASPGLLARIAQAAKDAIAPAKSYYELIKRFRSWRIDWNELQQKVGTRPGSSDEFLLKNSLDVMRLEYAKLDNQLMSEVCFADGASGDQAHKRESDGENFDFMIKIIGKLIRRLEDRLNALKDKSQEEILAEEIARRREEQLAEEEIERIERQVKVAADRAKRIAAKTAAGLAAQEFLAVAKLLAFDSLATLVANSSSRGADEARSGVMSRLEPIILVLGNANTPLIVSYLRDVQFRATLNLLNYTMSKISCQLRARRK